MATAKMHRALGWQRRNTYSIVLRQLSNNRNLFLPDGSRVPFNLWALIGPKSGSEKDILPLPQRMAALTRLLYRWGSNINAFETKCITNLKEDPDNFKTEPPPIWIPEATFSSKSLLKEWSRIKSDLNSEKRVDLIQNLGQTYLDLELATDKQNFYLRLDYYSTTVRLASLLQDILCTVPRQPHEIQLIQELADQSLHEAGSSLVAYHYWLILSKMDNDLLEAKRLLRHFPSILTLHEADILFYAVSYSRANESPANVMYPMMPQAFVLGEIENLVNTFFERYGKELTFEDRNRFLIYKAVGLFKGKYHVKGLKQLSEVCESFLANIDNVKSREAFGPQLFTAFNNFVDKSVRYSKMYSALELLFLMSNNLSRRHGNPILAFLFWDRVRKSERERDLILSLKLEKAWPFFPSVQLKLADRDKKQDLAKQELRKFRIYMDSLSKAQDSYRKNSSTAGPEKNHVQGKLADGSSISPGAEKETAAVATNLLVEDIEVPENVLMDMLDIKILEALQQGQNIEEAANFLIHEATTSKIYPNTNVLIALVQSICNKRDLALLAKIKQHLPHQSEPIEQLAQFEARWKLKEIYDVWKSGRNLQALQDLLKLYLNALENEHLLRFEALDSILTKIKNYLRLFLEEALLRGGGGEGGSEEEGNVIVFEEVQNLAFKISKELNDYSVLITYWEALFFAVRFEMKQKALTILKEHPNLASHIDLDRLLARARRFDNEELFAQILQLSLEYDMGPYEKSRAYEGLLVYQCEKGKIESAKKTIDSAQSLDISIGADAMARYYLLVKNNISQRSSEGIIPKFLSFFKK